MREPDADLSPVGSLALLWPAIPDSLISPAARSRIEAAAARLAPIARIALEVRLGEGRDAVDLHQFISRSPADAAALTRYHSERRETAPDGDIEHVLAAWAADAGGVRSDLDGFFLEWDDPGSCAGAAPGIFLPVQSRGDHGPAAAARRRRVAGHIDRLGLAGREASALLAAIPDALSISYIGFMLGRGGAVRVNLRAIRPDDLSPILAALAWPGDADQAGALFADLVRLTGQVAIALDFTPDIRPTIGFECALPHLPSEEPRWGELLDWLCAGNLCTIEKRSALERVGARLFPEEKGQAWPASWIVAAMRAPPTMAPWYERRLSHVKVSVGPAAEVSAKAYMSAQHHWARAADPIPVRAAPGKASASTEAIEAAAVRAAGFLVARRQQDDFWREFRLVNGESDEWVTAFVGYALATSGLPLPPELTGQSVAALRRRQRPAGGWGYNRISPADADSTAWVLKFLRAVGHHGPEVEAAKVFLRRHLLTKGGLATYAEGTSIRFGGDTPVAADAGWRSGHLCVAANAASLIGEPLTSHLIARQSADGAWQAYWWRSDAFASALAVEGLAGLGRAADSRMRAAAWAGRRAAAPATAFDTAWLIRILAAGDAADRLRARLLAHALAAEQQADGGWDSSAQMLFPDPAAPCRLPDAPVVRDHNRLFTAASALLALSIVLAEGDRT